ncbi:MAG: hypothetical protein ACYCZP_12765, partial [Acidimicrobiales bacterium]
MAVFHTRVRVVAPGDATEPQLLALARLGHGYLTGRAHRDIQRKWSIRGDVCGTCGRRRRS